MLLLPLLAAASCLSSALAYKLVEVCYGNDFHLHSEYLPARFSGKLVFTPTSGGARQVVMQNKEIKDPHYKPGHDSIVVNGVRWRDDGIFSEESVFGLRSHLVKLVILECADTVEKSYMDDFRHSPGTFEYVEYSTIGDPKTVTLLWNRTDPAAGRRRAHVRRNTWEMKELKRADSGFYSFVGMGNILSSRVKLLVTEYRLVREVEENMELYISYPGSGLSKSFWKVTFINGEDRVLMEDGRWINEWEYSDAIPNFISRIYVSDNSFSISPVTPAYAGTYEFRDRDDGLVLSIEVSVLHIETPPYVYAAIVAGGVLLIVICCCCCKKCCCKKADSKRSAPQAAAPPAAPATPPATYYRDSTQPSRTAAPAVYYHGATQPSGPTYPAHSRSASPAVAPSYRPLNPVSSGGEAPSHGPPTYNPVLLHDNAPQPSPAPQFTAPVPSFPMATDCLSSDAGPRFELKGMNFRSAAPLAADSTTTDVYTSDKLNFL